MIKKSSKKYPSFDKNTSAVQKLKDPVKCTDLAEWTYRMRDDVRCRYIPVRQQKKTDDTVRSLNYKMTVLTILLWEIRTSLFTLACCEILHQVQFANDLWNWIFQNITRQTCACIIKRIINRTCRDQSWQNMIENITHVITVWRTRINCSKLCTESLYAR